MNLIKALKTYGIDSPENIVYNPGYEQLFRETTKPELEGYDRGMVTDSGAVAVHLGNTLDKRIDERMEFNVDSQINAALDNFIHQELLSRDQEILTLKKRSKT